MGEHPISEAIVRSDDGSSFICSTTGAAYLLDMPVRKLWREKIETGDLGVIYLPTGGVEVHVPVEAVVRSPAD